jgi:hypothetical protein
MNIKKILITAGAGVIAFGSLAISAFAAGPNWNITGNWTFNDIYLGTPYVHTMVIDSFNPITGDFSGHGNYLADPTLTWIITGTENGNIINFNLLTGGSVPGVTLGGSGTVVDANLMSGTGIQSNLPEPSIVDWTAIGQANPNIFTKDSCKNGKWQSYGIFKNQGDCVSFAATGGKNPPANQ